MMTNPRSATVVLVDPGESIDSRGHPADDWTIPPAVETALPGAIVQTQSSTETTGDGHSRVVTTRRLFAPGARVTITARDRVRVGNLTYRIEGDPVVRIGAAGFSTYTTATLVRVVG